MSCSTTVCGTGGWNGPLPGDPDNSSVLMATSEFGGINLKWTIPNINAHAVAFTKIFRSTSADVNHSVIVGTQNGSSYFDVEPASNPTVTYYYWIQHVSINGSLLEYVGPASARAKPEIDKIIQLLAGRVETSALAQSLRSRIDTITNLESGITSLNTRLESENRLITEALDAVKNDVSEATSYIQSQVELFADEKVAFANAVNTRVSEFSEGVYASIREETTTRAEETGALFAEKLVKIDLAGNVSGYGLSAYVDPNGTSMSEFRVAADRFSVGAPAIVQSYAPTSNNYNGKVWVDTSVTPNVTKWYNATSNRWQTTPVKGSSPFIVKTSPETIDGVTIPPGVYIDSAVIGRIDASQINTRGLAIRDASGEIILGAGTSLDWDNIKNTPAFTGFATLSKITSDNISTYIAGAAIGTAYIENAAITTAKIGDAAVDTLRLAGSSVFASSRGYMADTRSLTINYNNQKGSWSQLSNWVIPGIVKNHSGTVQFVVCCSAICSGGGASLGLLIQRATYNSATGSYTYYDLPGSSASFSIVNEWTHSYSYTAEDVSPTENAQYSIKGAKVNDGGTINVTRLDFLVLSGKR